eukprot:3243948-Pyramimonas_sp.AAC.1
MGPRTPARARPARTRGSSSAQAYRTSLRGARPPKMKQRTRHNIDVVASNIGSHRNCHRQCQHG